MQKSHAKALTSIITFILLLMLLPGIAAKSQVAFTFTKLVSTNDTVPGTTSLFTAFQGIQSFGPSRDGDLVIFD